MGWTASPQNASDLINSEFGGAENIIKRSWGASSNGYKTCWVIFKYGEHKENTGLAVCLVHSYKQYGETWNSVKVVDEVMGPGELDVPDSIWNLRPSIEGRSQYAVEWRKQVEDYRSKWPLKVKDLDDSLIGTDLQVEGYEHKSYTFTGWKKHKASMVPTFNHRRITSWRTAHATMASS
jgi:hypothetical protein